MSFISPLRMLPNYRASREAALGAVAIHPVMGHGALAKGGKYGEVIHVTNLDDSGPGSLREAVNAEGARYVAFDVAGYIDLRSSLEIDNPYITIAGETAPEPGITLRKAFDVDKLGELGGCIRIGQPAHGDPAKFVDVHDVIIRHLRLRHGDGNKNQAACVAIHQGYDIVVDHCSMSWAPDNLLTLWLPTGDPPIYNITIQRCIFSEPMTTDHATAMAIHGSYDFDAGNRTYKDIYNISVHHNLFASFSHRGPMCRTGGTEVINNLVYNFDFRTFMAQADDRSDYIGNYTRHGPLLWSWQYPYSLSRQGCPDFASIYMQGNVIESFPEGDDWEHMIDDGAGGVIPPDARNRRQERLPQPAVPIQVQSAQDIVDDILDDSGATLPNRDVIDERIVNEVRTQTGISTYLLSVADAGGWPEL